MTKENERAVQLVQNLVIFGKVRCYKDIGCR